MAPRGLTPPGGPAVPGGPDPLGGLAPPVTLRPAFGEGLRLLTAPVMAAGDGLLAADVDRGLLCLDPATGHTRWATAAESGWGECLVDGTWVAAALAPGRLTVLDLATGSPVAEADTGRSDLFLRYSVAVGGAIAGPAADGTLGVWDLAAGSSIWRLPTDTRADARVAVGGGVVVAVAPHGLEARELGDGGLRWHVDVGELGARETIADGVVAGQVATPVLATDDTVWAGLSGGSVIAVAVDDGRLRWTMSSGAPTGHAIAVDPSGSLVVLADDYLIEVDGSSGAERHRARLDPDGPCQGPFTTVALSAGYAWTVDRQGRLLAIDRSQGRVTTVAETGAFVPEAPVLTGQAALVTTFEGELLAYLA